MKTLLPKLLDRTPQVLADIKLNLFISYCQKISHNNNDAQHLVTNQTLYNWFNKQVDMLEDEFLWAIANGRILSQTSMELYGIYYYRISKVNKLIPMKILNHIRKENKIKHSMQLNFNYN